MTVDPAHHPARTVTGALIPLSPGVAFGQATAAFLARHDLARATLGSYAQTLTRLVRDLGEHTPTSSMTPEQVAVAAAQAWGDTAPNLESAPRAAIQSFTAWVAAPGCGWVHAELAAGLDRRAQSVDRPGR